MRREKRRNRWYYQDKKGISQDHQCFIIFPNPKTNAPHRGSSINLRSIPNFNHRPRHQASSDLLTPLLRYLLQRYVPTLNERTKHGQSLIIPSRSRPYLFLLRLKPPGCSECKNETVLPRYMHACIRQSYQKDNSASSQCKCGAG